MQQVELELSLYRTMTLNSIWCAKSKTLTCLSLSERTYVPSGPLLYYTSHPNYASVDDSATRPFQMAMIGGLEDCRIERESDDGFFRGPTELFADPVPTSLLLVHR